MLSMDERKYLLEAVKEVVGNKCDIIVNIGMFATEHSIGLARHAEKIGVSAISSVPPFYFAFSVSELQQYYFDLADAVGVPVIVYNIPAMSSVHFSTDDLKKILEKDNIGGMKHTSYDLFQLQQIIEAYPEKSIFIGHDELFVSALAVGAKAGIGSTYNIMPKKFVKLMELYEKRDMNQALKVQNEINEMVSALCEVGVFKGVKEILRQQGIDCGECRKPFQPLTEVQKKKLTLIAEKNGIL